MASSAAARIPAPDSSGPLIADEVIRLAGRLVIHTVAKAITPATQVRPSLGRQGDRPDWEALTAKAVVVEMAGPARTRGTRRRYESLVSPKGGHGAASA